METQTKNKKLELILDICATASILNKFGYCHILSNQTLFIGVLNELGFRTTGGKEFTKMNFRKMFERITPKERELMISEFKSGYRDNEIVMEMISNS